MGKKIIAVALIALLTGIFMGCSNETSTDTKSKETYGYDEILSKIAASIVNGEEAENGEFSYMYPKFGSMGTSNFGYAYIQVDKNEQVLVVGENGTEEYPSILYDMYEEKNGELVHIFSGGEGDRYYATNITGAFIEEGSSSTDDSFFDTFIVSDGIRNSADFYRAPKKINIVLEPFVNQDSADKSNIEEKNIESKETYGYDEILSKISTSIENGEESDKEEFSYMYPKFGSMGTSNFGYAYIKINENEQALVVGENGTDEYPSILYDMYEEKNGELVHVFSGGDRDRYYATDTTGAFIEEGSSSADDSFFDVFIVNDGIRNSANLYRAPEKINIDLTPFIMLDDSENANIEGKSVEQNNAENKSNEKHSIEVTDYKEIIKKCPKSAKAGDKVTIKTNIFMDAIPKISVNGNDIGEWDKNRTEYTFIMPDEDVEIITTLRSAGES